jgi:hypothetical protein
MTIAWLLFLGEQLLAILIFSMVALISVRNRQKAFVLEKTLPQTESFPLERFQRFLSARSRVLRTYRQANTIVLFILAVIIGLMVSLENTSLTNIFSEDIVLAFLNPMIALIIGLLVGGYVNDIVSAIVVDGEAMQFFQMSTLQRNDIQKQKLHTFLVVYLPVLLILEFYIVLVFTNINFFIWLAIFMLFAIIRLVSRIVFALPYHAFIKAIRPLGQSEWAFLEQRIKSWANLMGVEIAGIYVQKDLIGQINSYTLGLGKPNLLISETFLRYSDWRQQDALICITLGLARKKVAQASVILNIIMLFVAFGMAFLLVTLINYDTTDFITPLLVLILIFILIRTVYSYAGRPIQKRYFAADQLASFVTGDPVALMVALNTTNTFNGVLPAQRTVITPSTAARMRNLDTLIRQSWPRATQAGLPVPSIRAVTFGQYNLTAPLGEATEAAPVPDRPFVTLQ